MTITTEDCKNFIKKNNSLLGYSNDNWKRVRKYKNGKLILRDFSNSDGEIVTVCEDELENLSIHNSEIAKEKKVFSNWLALTTEHYSDPCYEGRKYSPKEMLDEYLATVQHGMQHDSYTEEEVYFKVDAGSTFLIVPNMVDSGEGLMVIDLDELKTFGYLPKKSQSGYDFVDKNWNWY